MREQPTILVAGLGRCGTSMLMQMLHAGGIPCVGRWPAFEDDRMSTPADLAFVKSLGAVAVKRLDIHRDRIAPSRFITLWLDRDRDEQAKSMLKLLRTQIPNIPGDRKTRKGMVAGIPADTRACLSVLKGSPLLPLRFENILDKPLHHAEWIADFLFISGNYRFDHVRAATAVRARPPECLPYMLEIDMIAEREAGL